MITINEDAFTEAVARHQAGDLTNAERLYREVLDNTPNHPGAMSNLGVLVARSGNFSEAARLYTAAISANPGQLDAHFNLGNLLRKQNRPREAVAAYQAVLRLDPNHPRAWLCLGLALSDAGEWATAVDCFRRCVVLDPAMADAYNLLGDALYRIGRGNEAVDVFQQFVARCPEEPRGHHNLGLALVSLGQYEEAIPELERALALRPNYPDAHNSLGVALEGLGQADEAQTHYREATTLRPDFADAWSNLGTSLTEQGRVPESIEVLKKAVSLRADPRTASNMLLALTYSSDLSVWSLREEHISWATRFADPFNPVIPRRPSDRRSDRRLKIGYVSGDFRTHAAAGLIEVLLRHHDRSGYHITCYPNGTRANESTERLRCQADAWNPVGGLPDAQVAQMIEKDEIDILVDLSGHTAGNRLLVFARRPAPVQVTLFGSPCTTGLRTIDYRITDPYLDPAAESGEHYTESLLRLPEVAWVYPVPTTAPAPNPLPANSRRVFTFGCLNSPAKLSDACVEAWGRVLKAVPKSRLVLLAGRSAEAARQITIRFTRQGVAADRLEVVYRLPAEEYFDAYEPIDLALDPFPYNGGITTCDALWMGVPVLSVAGPDARSRQGTAILHNLGLPEFVADSADKLVDLATIWSDQRAGLADLRESLREMMRESPITQAARYVQNLEAAYRHAWQTAVR